MIDSPCTHCPAGRLWVDEAAGICACSSCGRVDESYTQLCEDGGNPTCSELVRTERLRIVLPSRATVLREADWLRSIEQIGLSLCLPVAVRAEAKALFVETSERHDMWQLGKKLLPGLLLMAACRRLQIPITMPEIASAVGTNLHHFGRHYSAFLLTVQLRVAPLTLAQLARRCVEEVQDEMVDLEWVQSPKAVADFPAETQSLATLLSEANIPFIPFNLVAQTVVVMQIGWSLCRLGKESEMRSWLCEKYGMCEDVFKRAHRKLRHGLVQYCCRIPGAMPDMTIKNVLSFLPTLRQYHQRLREVQEKHKGAIKTPVRHSHSVSEQPRRHRTEASAPAKKPGALACMQAAVRFEGGTESAAPGNLWRDPSISMKSLERKEKRKRGFERFLQSVNSRRKLEGRPEIQPFHGTLEVPGPPSRSGYCYALPPRPSSDALREIRKGRQSWRRSANFSKPPKPAPSRQLQWAPSKDDVTVDEDSLSDLEVDAYLLKPEEVLVKRLCSTLTPFDV